MDKVNKQELRRLAHEASEAGVEWPSFEFLRTHFADDWAALIEASSPSAILSLLDELESSSAYAWQKKCLEKGFEYVREPDDHYVVADPAEMVSLLRDLLGVDVRQKDASDYGQSVAELQEQIDGLVNTIHSLERHREDSERLQFMIRHGCVVDAMNGMGTPSVYRVVSRRDGWAQRDWHTSAEEAIDAAMAKEGGANG